MVKIFDLFGDEVPSNWGERGRPEHRPTQQNRNRVSMLVALGWSNPRIAKALYVTAPTLRKHYFSELKYREVARDRLDAEVATKFFTMFMEGNVSAGKEFRKLLERNDLMNYRPQARAEDAKQPNADKHSTKKLGKKEQAIVDAQSPDQGTALGELMARRQSAMN